MASNDDSSATRVAIIALAGVLAGALISGFITFMTTRASFEHEDEANRKTNLLSACRTNLSAQSEMVSVLEGMITKLVVLNDVEQFTEDIAVLNEVGSDGQATELYLVAPEEVVAEVDAFVAAINDTAIPNVIGLVGIPDQAREVSDQYESATSALADAHERIRRIGLACRDEIQ